MRTSVQRAGDAAESLAEARLTAAGWRILGRHIRVSRAEIDLLAVDLGPPRALVAVEVRWRRQRDFGLPEETVDRPKVLRLQRALLQLLDGRQLPDGTAVPRLPVRLDLVAIDVDRTGAVRMRHHRAIGA
jgi:Holliday junction resolvase-like predicted endonuclease